MDDQTEYSLKYQFEFPNIYDLKSGDWLTSTCSPNDTSDVNTITTTADIVNTSFTDTMLTKATIPNTTLINSTLLADTNSTSSTNIRTSALKTGTVITPTGFPLEFSLQLLYHKCARKVNRWKTEYFIRSHRLSLQLRLHQPKNVPFLPPLLIQPTLVPADGNDPNRPSWLNRRQIGPDQTARWTCYLYTHYTSTFPFQRTPLQLGGRLRFHLLDEPQRLIGNLPPPSEADWSCLPTDMITAVLSQLPLAERVKARLVCRTWARILDTDARAWQDITHLETGDMRNDVNDYDCGRLNRVRHDKLLQAIQFLVERKAPIRCLEYETSNQTDYYQYLSSILSVTGIRLKALYTGCDSVYGPDDTLHPTLMQLLNAQPTIERLYLGLLPTRLLYLNTPLPPTWHHLRILSLSFFNPDEVDMMISQANRLRALHGLRIVLAHSQLSAADIIQGMKSKVPSFRRVQTLDWPSNESFCWAPSHLTPCGCYVNRPRARYLVFGTEQLSPYAAAYLLMPEHMWDRNVISHHHI